MPLFFNYLLKFSISLAIVFLFYQFVLRKLTFYNSNRWYLLGYTFLSFLIPFINITPVLRQNQWSEIKMVQWVPVINNTELNSAHETTSLHINYWFIVALLIFFGMLCMLCRLLVQFISFRKMRRRAEFISGKELKIYQVNESIIPFSFGDSIFINRNQHSDEELQEIIRHEFVHVKQKHSLDIIWGEILCILNWYNPFAWLLKKSIRQNLEFIADNKVLRNGISKKDYQYLLLKVIGNNQYSLAIQFNFSSLKKRITMMNKIRTARLHLIKFLFILPLVAVMLLSFRQNFPKSEPGDSVFLNIHGDTLPVRSKADIPDNVKNIHIDDDNKAEVKLRDGKTEKYDLNVSAEKAEFEKKYGELPAPPPRLEVPLAVPPPIKLPENVSRIDINNKQATVKLKNGNKEKYDLNDPKEKTEFERKYGEVLPPPPPLKKISAVSLSTIGEDYEITDKKATLHLKDGTTEEYDLTNKEQKQKFEKKYGKIITVNAVTAPTSTVAPVKVVTGGTSYISAPVTVYTKVGKTISSPVSTTATISDTTITRFNSVTDVTSYVSAPVAVYTSAGRTISSSESVKGKVTGNTVTFPRVSVAGVIADDHSYVITGNEDVLVVITRNSSSQQLEEFKQQMKEKGIELNFDNITFDNKGILTHISGTMKSDDGSSRFSATDFKELILATIKDGNRTYFKVNVKDNKKVVI